MSSLRDIVLRNRSYRRFDESHAISRDDLVELIDLARHTASAGNLQPLKYFLSADPEMNKRIFPCLTWAAYLEDWDGPERGERPTGYIVLLIDDTITKNWWCDDGIAAQTILLGAAEKGLGGCIMGAVDRPKLRALLSIPDNLKIRLVLALGKPAETVEVADLGKKGDIRYWRDEKDIHHVPKRTLKEIIVG